MLLGAGGAVDTKTYVDDVFNTDVWKGDGAAHQVVNNINLSGEGGMVWMKSRSNSDNHLLVDTVRGSNKVIFPDTDAVEQTSDSYFTSLNNNGFTTGSSSYVNDSSKTFASWTFRKSSAFTICTWTGNGSNRQISHDLSSIPGMILIKNLSTSGSSGSWTVYHRSTKATHFLELDNSDAASDSNTQFNDTEPTASVFTVGTDDTVNKNGDSFVAYLFAGGKQTTDKAVEFDGTNDYLTIPDNDAWNLGNTFTIEAWVNLDALNDYNVIIAQGSGDWYMSVNSNGSCQFYDFTGSEQIDSAASAVSANTWTHIAIVANAGTAQWYVNGKQSGSSGSLNVQGGSNGVSIGAQVSGYKVNGEISNLRVTKGQALYTTNFNVPQDPLTQTSQNAVSSNVKLLCCNGSTATASTVTPDTISATGSPSVTTNNSIFNDPAAYVFGESESESVISCGSYVGNGSTTGPEVYLGWEPQWVLVKNASAGENWKIFDSMRGIPTDAGDAQITPNANSAESTSTNFLDLTPTGFKVKTTDGVINGNGNTIVYMCLRRPDGYVGKPPELGTDVFAMDTGSSSSTIPNFDSGFPVDFTFFRKPAANGHWELGARLIQGKFHYTDDSDAEMTWANMAFDSNVGWEYSSNHDSAFQSWMFKRHAGMDVVTYKGDHVDNRQLPHQLSKAPEMIWTHARDTTENWVVWHTGMPNSGDGENATAHALLNLNNGVSHSGQIYGGTDAVAPTSTHWSVGTHESINDDRYNYLSMLFTSVSGISKCGSYNGSNSSQTITTGFQPRFVIIKRTDSNGEWYVLDTTRGWGSGDDKAIKIDYAQSQFDHDMGAPTSTGFTLTNNDAWNNASKTYIYYAHA